MGCRPLEAHQTTTSDPTFRYTLKTSKTLLTLTRRAGGFFYCARLSLRAQRRFIARRHAARCAPRDIRTCHVRLRPEASTPNKERPGGWACCKDQAASMAVRTSAANASHHQQCWIRFVPVVLGGSILESSSLDLQ